MEKPGYPADWGLRVRRLCSVLIAAMLLSFANPIRVSACACCSDPGMRIESAEDMNQYERGELSRLRFEETAQLFASPVFPEDIKGIVAPSDEPYSFRGVMGPTRWTFELADSAGKQGIIVFPLPLRLVKFVVDPRDEEATSPGRGPRLYKEWRLESTAGLSGIVAQGNNQAHATLILHGHGNGCTSAEDFTHWTLMIRGPGVRFTLLGKLGNESTP